MITIVALLCAIQQPEKCRDFEVPLDSVQWIETVPDYPAVMVPMTVGRCQALAIGVLAKEMGPLGGIYQVKRWKCVDQKGLEISL